MTVPPKQSPKRRKRSARFTEIAELAGVSHATVDRVLNERDSVSDKTRRKVLAAARDLGVRRLLPEPEHALLHLDILLPKNDTPFFRRLAAAFRDGAAMLDRRVTVHRRTLPEGDAAAMAAAIRAPHYRRAGVIFAAPDTTEIRAATLEAIGRGEAAVAVVTNLPDLPGLIYCGMDNYRAGRVAGHLMGRLVSGPGRILALGNTALYRAHLERFDGFAETVSAFPGRAVELIEARTGDDAARCHEAMRRAIAQGGAIAGVYNTGAGSAGIHSALALLGAPRPIWIGHEVSDDHIAYLREDAMHVAIDQDAAGQAIASLQSALRAMGVIGAATTPAPAELRIHTRFSIA